MNGEASILTTENTPAPSAEFSIDNVPEEIREKGYWKEVKTNQDLYKQFDNLQKMLGQRGQMIPSADEGPEAWDKFYKSAGRPDDIAGYAKEEHGNADFMESMRGEFLKAGLNVDQGNAITGAIAAQFNKDSESINSIAESNAKRASELLAGFGDKSSEKIEFAKKALMDSAAGKMLVEGEQIDPLSLSVFASAIDEFMEKYDAPDKLPGDGFAARQPEENLQEELNLVMSHKAFKDPFNAEYEEKRARFVELCAKVDKKKASQ